MNEGDADEAWVGPVFDVDWGGRAVGDRSVVVVVVATSRSPLNLSPFGSRLSAFSLPDPARAAVLSSGGS